MIQVMQVGLVRHDRERGTIAILDDVSFTACEEKITAIIQGYRRYFTPAKQMRQRDEIR